MYQQPQQPLLCTTSIWGGFRVRMHFGALILGYSKSAPGPVILNSVAAVPCSAVVPAASQDTLHCDPPTRHAGHSDATGGTGRCAETCNVHIEIAAIALRGRQDPPPCHPGGWAMQPLSAVSHAAGSPPCRCTARCRRPLRRGAPGRCPTCGVRCRSSCVGAAVLLLDSAACTAAAASGALVHLKQKM